VVLTNNRDGGDSFCPAATFYVLQGLLGLEHQGEDEILQEYQNEHAAIAEIVATSPPVTWRETRSYLGAYEHHVRAAFEHRSGFTLLTELGELPLISLAQLGEPGVYVTAGAWIGLVTRFSQDTMTFGDDENEIGAWTLHRLASIPGPHRLPHWHWPSHIRRPAFRSPIR